MAKLLSIASLDHCIALHCNCRPYVLKNRGVHVGIPPRARNTYLVPGSRSLAVTGPVLLLECMERQTESLCSRISISQRHPFGSCAHMPQLCSTACAHTSRHAAISASTSVGIAQTTLKSPLSFPSLFSLQKISLYTKKAEQHNALFNLEDHHGPPSQCALLSAAGSLMGRHPGR